ncbi:hypothetical protein [Xanthomonas sp. WHRI 7945]|nr:hypothetical protein [Xanthomonas campestris pv. campestris]
MFCGSSMRPALAMAQTAGGGCVGQWGAGDGQYSSGPAKVVAAIGEAPVDGMASTGEVLGELLAR